MDHTAGDGDVELEWAGGRWRLLPERAAWRPDERTLIIADTHFGKAATFREAGIAVPETAEADLARLFRLIERTGAERLVVLGDFFHAASAHCTPVLDALRRWRRRTVELAVVLVRGNHDRHAGDPPADLGIACVDEPWLLPEVALVHEPGPDAAHDAAALSEGERPRIAGHLHPAARLRDVGGMSARLPCFVVDPACLILPAFGAFTGMHPVRRAEGRRLLLVTPERLIELPAGRGRRRRWTRDQSSVDRPA